MLQRIREKWLTTLLAFVILATAIPPFIQVYHLGSEAFLIGLLGIVCLITGFIRHPVIRTVLYLVFYLFGLHHYFPYDQSFSFTWFQLLLHDIVGNLQQMLAGRIGYFPEAAALGVILFLLIALAILLIDHERWVLCFGLVLTYLLILVVFNQMDLSKEVLIIAGCILLISLETQLSKELTIQKRMPPISAAGLLLLILAVVALFAPLDGVKNQLVSATGPIRDYMNKIGLYSKIRSTGLPVAAKTGFSEDDQVLGGPIADDATILFEVLQESSHYWRVEAKDVYTGTGWNTSTAANQGDHISVFPVLTVSDSDYQQAYEPEEMMEVEIRSTASYLPLPYGMVRSTNSIVSYQVNAENSRVNLTGASVGTKLTFHWLAPTYSVELLDDASLTQPNSMVNYLQLPSTLPERVRELSADLTEPENTLYTKTKAVESYLRLTGGLRYSKTDADYTPAGEDYVDHFLFESKVGYCDNFSTSMVVLLRASGIPARWVKGFSPGDYTSVEGDNPDLYTIRNSHAHSWVEVYFENFGWVAFEPTPSFVNPNRPTEETADSDTTEASSSDDTQNSSEDATTNSTSSTSSSQENSEESDADWWSFLKEWVPALKTLGWIVLLVAAIALAYILRHHSRYLWLILLSVTNSRLVHTYPQLLKMAEQRVYRSPAEPLLPYARRFEEVYPVFHGSLIQLTELYEEQLFAQTPNKRIKERQLVLHVAKLLRKIKIS